MVLAQARWLAGLLHYGAFTTDDIADWLLSALAVDGADRQNALATIRDGILTAVPAERDDALPLQNYSGHWLSAPEGA